MFRGASPCGCLYAGYQPCVYPEGDGRDSGQLPEAPAAPFEERELSVDECAGYLQKAINLLKSQTAASGSSEGTLKVIITVSPYPLCEIRLSRESASKATLLAADKLVKENPEW